MEKTNYVSKISDVGLARLVPAALADSITQYGLKDAAGTFSKNPIGLSHQVEQAVEKGTFSDILDPTQMDWLVEEALSLAKLALKCCELRKKDRPDLASVSLTTTPSLSSTANISLPTTLEVPPPSRAGPLSIGVLIIQLKGAAALFSDVSATILRQTLYSTTCVGLYDVLKHRWTDVINTNNMPLVRKIVARLISSAVRAAVGSLQMRQCQMSKQDGVARLWRGSGLTVNCAMIVTVSQLASYDQAKEMILEKGLMNGGIGTHVTASFVASVASNPIDVIKTRVMNMKVKPGVKQPYKGALDCAMKTIKAEGPMVLYKGFIPTISRQGPFTVVLFVTLEQVRRLLKDF
ncbi:unnamed protein product [Dovyalis caffra]|uniref:Uncharacterized protein n=1 Tax=Dovyalis caffra TaxID=77055 RepID=A0AAV1SR12_9ROSI|nr:unnamed protein product [Dovyalis caffra]